MLKIGLWRAATGERREDKELWGNYLYFVSWPSPKPFSIAQEKSRFLTKLALTFLGLLQVLQEESNPIKEA